jgi:hypothetical protein
VRIAVGMISSSRNSRSGVDIGMEEDRNDDMDEKDIMMSLIVD